MEYSRREYGMRGVDNQARTLNSKQRAGRNIRKAWPHRSQGKSECLPKEGVPSSVKCCQEIVEIKTESIYWLKVTSGLEVSKEAEYSWLRKTEGNGGFVG